jgi:hypothetical protein
VPAAAVIPAPIAYIKVVAVKKLVVEPKGISVGRPWLYCCGLFPNTVPLYFVRSALSASVGEQVRRTSFTVKKLECSKQAVSLEYISME